MHIYCVTNSVNGKRYVGQTTRSIQHRFKQHLSLIGACRVLGNAIKKYGAAAFSIQEIDAATSQSDLDARERFWISRLNTIRPNGYNLMVGGNGGPMHPETRERIKIANIGHRPSLETRIKLKLSHTGKKHSEETRRKMTASLTGRSPSAETREKLRIAGIGHTVSEATRAKIASALSGRFLSEETKQKIRNTNAGRILGPPASAETRAKIGAATRARRTKKEE